MIDFSISPEMEQILKLTTRFMEQHVYPAERQMTEEGLPKEIRLNSGGRMLVQNREQWLASPDYLIVLDRGRHVHHVSYRNITEIRHLRRGSKRQRRAGA